MSSSQQESERIQRLAGLLRDAERPLRVLRTVSWPPEVRARFFAAGAKALPVVVYQPPDLSQTDTILSEVRRALRPGEAAIEAWLRRQTEAIATGARMLRAVGTPAFFTASQALYGAPKTPLADGINTTLGLAQQLEDILLELTHLDLGAPNPACHLATGVAERMRQAVIKHFGDSAPEVVIVDHLSANALAGPRAIRILRSACFTDRDVYQLIHHEAYIHVATSLNGKAQEALPILAAGHPGTTRTQEGLAVFAELISGTLDPDRFRRLADRVLCIQMAIEGADFLDVYRFLLEDRGLEPEPAFESARRVFRGGVLSGGAPFTKDGVYLGGLLRVHNFLRAAVLAGRSDCLRLLFSGKLDVEDVPALAELAVMGLCKPPRFLPPWAADRRFLVSYLAYSGFLNKVDLSKVRESLKALLARTPVIPSAREGVASRPATAHGRV